MAIYHFHRLCVCDKHKIFKQTQMYLLILIYSYLLVSHGPFLCIQQGALYRTSLSYTYILTPSRQSCTCSPLFSLSFLPSAFLWICLCSPALDALIVILSLSLPYVHITILFHLLLYHLLSPSLSETQLNAIVVEKKRVWIKENFD